MPEWPELRVMQERIADALVGKKVVAVRVGDPVVLRAEKPVDELLVGHALRSVAHHGKFLIFAFDGLDMTVNPMLAGLFLLQPVGSKATKDTRMRLEFEGGTELRYRDDVRMGKVYVGIDAPGLSDIGPDAGTFAWSEATFGAGTCRELESGAAVGELLIAPFDVDGRFLADDLRARTIAFDARDLPKIPVRIGVAGGQAKVRPILGALRAGSLTMLVSDVRTAEAVVALDGAGAPA